MSSRISRVSHRAMSRSSLISCESSCYLITHAHLDHVHSLILLSGSIPPRQLAHGHSPGQASSSNRDDPYLPRPHIYGTKSTLKKLALAYGGELWPELSSWEQEEETETTQVNGNGSARKRRKREREVDSRKSSRGTGVVFSS